MSERRRRIRFTGEDDVIAEVDRLRANGYRKLGNWSLPMICWHLDKPGADVLRAPATLEPTPEQAAAKKGFIDFIFEHGRPPADFVAPPELIPPDTCDDAAVDGFKSTLAKMKAYPHSHVEFGPFGPVPIETLRKLTCLHSAHHLSHLEPTATAPTRRADLRYVSEGEAIADINRLRHGYTQAGAWSLPRICAHLDKSMQYRMRPGPFPPNTPEQDARKEMLRQVLTSGKVPDGMPAPDPMQPALDTGDDAIDACVAMLTKFQNFPGPFAPHRVFGHLDNADARRLNLHHCAHHLSYLTPKS